MRKRITWSMVLFLSILLPACRSQREMIEAPANVAQAYAESIGSAAVMLVQGGTAVAAWYKGS